MGKEIDSFLNNECMKVIIELVNKYPNDMELGVHVRSFLRGLKTEKNKIKIEFTKKDL